MKKDTTRPNSRLRALLFGLTSMENRRRREPSHFYRLSGTLELRYSSENLDTALGEELGNDARVFYCTHTENVKKYITKRQRSWIRTNKFRRGVWSVFELGPKMKNGEYYGKSKPLCPKFYSLLSYIFSQPHSANYLLRDCYWMEHVRVIKKERETGRLLLCS